MVDITKSPVERSIATDYVCDHYVLMALAFDARTQPAAQLQQQIYRIQQLQLDTAKVASDVNAAISAVPGGQAQSEFVLNFIVFCKSHMAISALPHSSRRR